MNQIVAGLVSVIIPVYNRESLIQECVSSVINQSYSPVETIIVNDGSTDGGATDAACRRIASRHENVSYFYQDNQGPGVAREIGRKHARGEFVGYLDSDDLFYPNKLALQVAALRENPDVDVAYGYVEQCEVGAEHCDNITAWGRSGENIRKIFPDILRGRHWCTSCPLYRRSLLNKVGSWSALRYGEDLEYDIRVAISGATAINVREFLVKFRNHPHRVSLNFKSALPFQHQTQAKLLISRHIVRSNIPLTDPSVQHFARGLFLSSRQLGAMGLINEARECLSAARRILKLKKKGDPKSFAYEKVAMVLGYQRTGLLASRLDAIRAGVLRRSQAHDSEASN